MKLGFTIGAVLTWASAATVWGKNSDDAPAVRILGHYLPDDDGHPNPQKSRRDR